MSISATEDAAAKKDMKRISIENSFRYHRPTPTQIPQYEQIRQKAKEFALFILDSTPASREQAVALTKIEEAVMWANKAKAVNENSEWVG